MRTSRLMPRPDRRGGNNRLAARLAALERRVREQSRRLDACDRRAQQLERRVTALSEGLADTLATVAGAAQPGTGRVTAIEPRPVKFKGVQVAAPGGGTRTAAVADGTDVDPATLATAVERLILAEEVSPHDQAGSGLR